MTKQTNSFFLLFPLLALGIYLGSLSSFKPAFILCIFLVSALLWLSLAYRGLATKGWLFWLTLTLGMSLMGNAALVPERAWEIPTKGSFSGSVLYVRALRFDTRVFVRLEPSKLQVAVHLPLEVPVMVGDQLTFEGIIQMPPSPPNPGVFDYRKYLRNFGVFGLCYPMDWEIQGIERQRFADRLREKFGQNIRGQMQDPSLVLSLVLGQREELSEIRNDTWRLLGISHLLAISGMHVGFLALGFGLLMERLPLRSIWKLTLTQLLLLGYILLIGNGISAWRAFLSSALGAYGIYRGYQRDSLRIWAMVGWLILLIEPQSLFKQAFTLSFAASGGIILWAPLLKWKTKNKVLGYLVNSLLISLIAQLSLVPLLLRYFGEIALLGPFATLLFVPLVIVLLLGGIGLSLGLGSVGLSLVLNRVMGLVEILENLLLPWAGQWKRTHGILWEVYLWWFLFLYVAWSLRQPRITKPRRTYIKLCNFFVLALVITCLPPVVKVPLEVTAVNVGQGDCYYIRTPGGIHLLIDGGGDSPYWQERGRNVGKERLVPYLQHRNVTKIDYIILSHPHEDHLFGLLAVLEDFEVGMVIDNGHSHTSPTYERYLDLLRKKSIPYQVVQGGDWLSLGHGICLEVLYPNKVREHLPSAHNNNSLLLRLQYGGFRLLFTGDLEWPLLYDLAHDPTLDLKAQWLKVPHHGSNGSLYEGFYQAVAPKWATISVGPNSFGHPHQEVLTFLKEQKITFRTTEKGPQTFQVWWGILGRFLPDAR